MMMTLERLKTLIDAYGADPERWPAAEREAARSLLARSADARAYAKDAAELDAVLDRVPLRAAVTVDAATLAERVMRTPVRLVAAAAAWRVSFGWPNFAALAAAAAIGLVVGWTDFGTGQGSDVLEQLSPVAVAENPLW